MSRSKKHNIWSEKHNFRSKKHNFWSRKHNFWSKKHNSVEETQLLVEETQLGRENTTTTFSLHFSLKTFGGLIASSYLCHRYKHIVQPLCMTWADCILTTYTHTRYRRQPVLPLVSRGRMFVAEQLRGCRLCFCYYIGVKNSCDDGKQTFQYQTAGDNLRCKTIADELHPPALSHLGDPGRFVQSSNSHPRLYDEEYSRWCTADV